MSSQYGEPKSSLHGVMAEFEDPESLVAAAHQAREAGYTKMDAYTPFPIEELNEALGLTKSFIPLVVLIGGLTGLAAGYGLQYWISVINYPLMVGGRPFHSWPSFIPVSYELMILFASFAAVISLIVFNGLPMPYHPVFNVERFSMASNDRFFLCIEAEDPNFDREKTTKFLEQTRSSRVSDVES